MLVEPLRYLIKPQEFDSLPPNWEEIFGRRAPLWIEIGFGNGEFLAFMTKKHPEVNFVGFELSLTSFVKAQKRLYREGAENVVLVMVDGRFGLRELFRDGEVEKVFVNFPCPWSKKSHENRRITSGDFIETLAAVLKNGGTFELMTDDENYAKEVFDKFKFSGYFSVDEIKINYKREFSTRYERKWKEMGRRTYFIKAYKIKNAKVPRLTWEVDDVHIRIEKANLDRLLEIEGKVFKGRNDRIFIVKEIFLSSDKNKALARIISSDKSFQQNYMIRVERKRDFWLVELDSSCKPYRTPAVKWSVVQISKILQDI